MRSSLPLTALHVRRCAYLLTRKKWDSNLDSGRTWLGTHVLTKHRVKIPIGAVDFAGVTQQSAYYEDAVKYFPAARLITRAAGRCMFSSATLAFWIALRSADPGGRRSLRSDIDVRAIAMACIWVRGRLPKQPQDTAETSHTLFLA